ISPIADPDHVILLGAVQRLEIQGIGGLMEGPGARHAEPFLVYVAYGSAKSEHAIEKWKVELEYLFGLCIGAVVAIVQKSGKPKSLFESENTVDHEGRVPFMDQYQVSPLKLAFQKLSKVFSGIIEANIQLRKGPGELF